MTEIDAKDLDFEVIEALRALGGEDDPDLLHELIETYLEDAPRHLEDMRLALAEGDQELMRRSAHTLKSSSANLGGARLSAVCRAMESAARTPDVEEYGRLIQTCLGAYADLERELRQLS